MDKVAIVTGGTRGIGLGVSKELYQAGYRVATLGRTKYPEIEALERETEGMIQFFSFDLAEIDKMDSCIEAILEKMGKIDVLVNNAGVAPKSRDDILSATEENFDFVVNRNLKGTYFFTQKVAKKMIAQERKGISYIINISSLSAYATSLNRGEYCISKAGISMITKLFAHRLAEEGIYVYEIRPGIIKTDMTAAVTEKYTKQIEEGTFPIPRWGYPEDIAKAVLAFVSNSFPYSTGDILNVDGGYHLRRF
ncbi:MAG: 3-ketoacyl-ACP reductase [Tissierellia bacterium]|nr:3-ketoacyl-ACP reductase [Tissierellia bacterium]